MLKKSLGQHILKNKTILQKIVDISDIHSDDTVLEIGPGLGALTDVLLETGAHIIAVEKDDNFVKQLAKKYENKNIEIIHDDILKYNPSFKISNSKFKIVGNIPYYLTGHLLRIMLTTWPSFESAVLMVQKEVAQRMLARSPNMNMLAVLVQCYTEPKLITYVKKGNFSPPPKVDSAIVRLVLRGSTSVSLEVEPLKLLEVAAKGFKNPRKKLSNNLPKELLERANIDPNRRAETLTIKEWQALASVI